MNFKIGDTFTNGKLSREILEIKDNWVTYKNQNKRIKICWIITFQDWVIKNINTLEDYIHKLTPREKKVLKIASTSIYLNDRSDYIKALWEIVNELSDNKIEDCNSELYDLLNN